MIRLVFAILAIVMAVPAAALPCPGNLQALGTARVLAVNPAAFPRIGRKHFPQTLPLAPKEVVLTFDDGPVPGTTPHVLETLRQDCVRATFFLLGRNAAAHPEIARRIAAGGHSVGHHSYSHPLLSHLSLRAAEAEIDRGLDAIEKALGRPGNVKSFFRFPGFAASPALLKLAAERGMIVFGADLWASDWNPMTPQQELRLVTERIAAARGGIVLLHDTQRQTAAMLPGLIRWLKRQGYTIVHVVPAGAPAARRTEISTTGRGVRSG